MKRSSRLPFFLTSGFCQPVGIFGIVIGEATLVAHPDLVDRFVLARHDALDGNLSARHGLTAGVEGQVAAHRALRTDGSGGFHFPGASPEAEIRGGQSADRADIGGVAGEDRVEARLGVGDDVGGTCHAGRKSSTGSPAISSWKRMQRAHWMQRSRSSQIRSPERDMLGGMGFLIINVAALRGSVRHGQVLERTFAALVADRAVERMGGEQELEDLLLGSPGFVGAGQHQHAFGDRGGAGGFEFGTEVRSLACRLSSTG